MKYCYNRDCEPISVLEFEALLGDTSYVVVRKTQVRDAEVSTVWLGVDHAFGFGTEPLIFETMIFGGSYDMYQWRYATELEALAGHEAVVASLLAGDGPPTIEIPEDDEVEFE